MTDSAVRVSQATLDDLETVVALFDAYRQFYGQTGDRDSARDFLAARFERGESVVLLARDGEEPVGFTQLYPAFSSVSMRPLWILNDLFVAATARRRGVATALLEAAVDHGRRTNAVRLVLATAHDNIQARSLYEAAGWTLDEAFLHYNYPLD